MVAGNSKSPLTLTEKQKQKTATRKTTVCAFNEHINKVKIRGIKKQNGVSKDKRVLYKTCAFRAVSYRATFPAKKSNILFRVFVLFVYISVFSKHGYPQILECDKVFQIFCPLVKFQTFYLIEIMFVCFGNFGGKKGSLYEQLLLSRVPRVRSRPAPAVKNILAKL